MESIEYQEDILSNLEYDGELQKVHESKSEQLEESKRNEQQRKVKGNNDEVPQEFAQNYKTEENEENAKRRIIKIEKFECSDDNLSQIGLNCEQEESTEIQNNLLIKLEHRCEKPDNESGSTICRIEESKKNEGHRKIIVDEFTQNVEAVHKSIKNYEVDKNEVNEKRVTIKAEKFEYNDNILPQTGIGEPEESREMQKKMLLNLEHHGDKPENVLVSTIYQIEESKKIEGHRKIKGNEFSQNVEAAQESIKNYEADKNEVNVKRVIIKAEKFEYSDNILPQTGVGEPEESREMQKKLLVNLEHHGDKPENVLVSTIYQIEESKKIEGHRKIKGDEFSQNVEAAQESIQNYEADKYEDSGKDMIIKIEKFECSDDILPQISVDCYEPEQNTEHQNNVLVKSEHRYDKLSQTSQVILSQPEEYGENQRNKDSTAIVGSTVYQVSDESNSSIQPYSKQRRREGNLSEKQNHKYLNVMDEFKCISDNYKDTTSSELAKDDDSESVNVEASKVLVTDSQCYVALEKLTYKCDICRYVTVIKEMLVSHMKLHNFKQFYSITERELQSKNKIISEKYEDKKNYDKPFACNVCSYKSAYKSHLNNHKFTHTGEKPFACNVCSYKSVNKSALNSHILTHTGEKSFGCNMCSYKSAWKSTLNKHILTHTGEKRFACNVCSYKCVYKSTLNKHTLTHTGEKRFACNVCSYKSVAKSSLNRHILTHTGEKPFACNVCSYKSVYKSSLNKHKLIHTGKKPFACNVCPYKSVAKSSLNRHILTHTGEKRFTCNVCSYKCVYKSTLNKHILTHTGEKRFACNVCPYKSVAKSSLNRHILTHTGEKPFACNVCSYKSARKAVLLQHQLTHTGEKPFACNLCSYKCASKSSFNIHKLTHTGEKPFACNLCPYKSAQKSLLNIHMYKHTGERRFACNVCSYKSVYKSSLNEHILTHTGEKPFACNLCSYKCASKSNFNIHKLTHTGEKPFACNVCSYKSVYKSCFNRHKLTHTGEKPFACNLCSYKSIYKSCLKRHILKHQ